MRSLEQRFDGLDNAYVRSMILHGMALVELDEGLLPAAQAHLDRALAEAPETSMQVDVVLCERVRLFALLGDAEAMQREYERALARLPAPPQASDSKYQWLLSAYGRGLDALGRSAEALGPLEQRRAALVAADRPIEAAPTAVTLAEIRLKLGRLDEAESDLQGARADPERLTPPNNLILARANVVLAELSLARGRFEEAAEFSGAALSAYEAVAEPDHLPALRARFARARALTGAAPEVPAEARRLVDAALAGWRGKARETELRRATEWLAGHGAAP
ncbi:tetratricopeptide repeat protein [Nannocystis pusilla]|uniref:Tetratricopeptide repeat protein n=1 Tax=Nannocystis pusilla TaxID=889268 RepID=A0A9X3F188_9BACT|nr:tetratricopeptide repeat protein [Nannocystis pusilla]MCY1013981.1 tetratricopeptide repeat protein [Nannocystis pusilla]